MFVFNNLKDEKLFKRFECFVSKYSPYSSRIINEIKYSGHRILIIPIEKDERSTYDFNNGTQDFSDFNSALSTDFELKNKEHQPLWVCRICFMGCTG